jgi:AcrR family transcriptional regulator
MDKSVGQTSARRPPKRRTAGSAATREGLLAAAAELIAEVGWGRVTTRAVAERAGLPHGSVSYHFNGKQDLLIAAAMHAFQAAVPKDQFESPSTTADLIDVIDAQVGDPEALDPQLSRLMLESMREAERDPELRGRLSALLDSYRQAMIEVIRDDQERGAVRSDLSPEAIATLLGGAGDGLLLHALLDPKLDSGAAIAAMRALLCG